MISGFSNVSMTFKANMFYLWRDQDTSHNQENTDDAYYFLEIANFRKSKLLHSLEKAGTENSWTYVSTFLQILEYEINSFQKTWSGFWDQDLSETKKLWNQGFKKLFFHFQVRESPYPSTYRLSPWLIHGYLYNPRMSRDAYACIVHASPCTIHAYPWIICRHPWFFIAGEWGALSCYVP